MASAREVIADRQRLTIGAGGGRARSSSSEDLRSLERREVTASGVLGPSDEVMVVRGGRPGHRVGREESDAGRDTARARRSRRRDAVLEVQVRGHRGRPGDPVQDDEVQRVVEIDVPERRAGRVRPVVQLVEHPGELPDGRVRERVAERVRAGRLQCGIPTVGRRPLPAGIDPGTLIGSLLGQVRRDIEVAVHVDPEHAHRIQPPDPGRHDRPRVPTRRAELLYPSRPMRVSHASAIRTWSQPGPDSGVEKPDPGNDGATTWKASAGSPACRAGSVSGPTRSRRSSTEPGQPCVSSSGSASGSAERTCTRWIRWLSIVVTS